MNNKIYNLLLNSNLYFVLNKNIMIKLKNNNTVNCMKKINNKQ